MIICCGKDSVIKCIQRKKDDTYLEIEWDGKTQKIPLINAYHTSRSSDENFFCMTLKQMEEMGVFEK